MNFLKSNYKVNPFLIVIYLILFLTSLSFNYYSIGVISLSIALFFILFWFGHGLGQHRLLSHNTFSTHPILEGILVYLASLIPFGSPFGWAALHKAHHRYSGTFKDTYYTKNPLKIFFCVTNPNYVSPTDCKNLNRISVKITHNYYHLILLLSNVLFFIINKELWIAYNLAALLCCVAFIWTWAVAHTKTPLSYSNFKNDSYNDIFCGYILGEWHNNHHSHPGRANQQIKWWEFDILYQFIRILKK